MARRSRRLVLVAHCILNQNAVVAPLARAPGVLEGIVAICAEAGVGILQLPCPELLDRGPTRAQAERHSYDTAAHRAHCRRILAPVRDQVRAYEQAGYRVVGLIGIGHSPSCGVRTTHEGGKPVPGRGVFMEELLAMLPELEGRALEVPRDYPDDPEVRRRFEAELRAFCRHEAPGPQPREGGHR